jgi:hypothetical protein
LKPIRITDYCEGRIVARKLDCALVEQVIRSPEQVVPDEDDPNRQIHQSRFRDVKGVEKLLRIVVEENKDEIVAVTVYSASKFKRYWKGAS